MIQLRAWPQGLVGRAMVVLILAVLLEFVGSSILYERTDLFADRGRQMQHLAEQLVAAERVFNTVPAKARAHKAQTLSTHAIHVDWSYLPPFPDEPLSASLLRAREQIVTWEPALANQEMRLWSNGGRWPADQRLKVALKLEDGSWLYFKTRVRAGPWAMVLGGVGSAFILASGVLIASGLLLRSMGAPLRVLAKAAHDIGEGKRVTVPEEGAGDLKLVAQAFNSMQTKIADLGAARTQALAAVSHDLRTPLARLRLRSGGVADDNARRAMERDIDEMTAMLDSLLSYLGGRADPEARRRTDLAAIAMTLVDAATDAGGEASYVGPDHMVAEVRPVAVKRALSNLIDNALAYGTKAVVSLRSENGQAVIRVEDDGPGIPEESLSRVLEPFQRLDSARARNTSGLGLGLSIVQKAVEDEGGTLKLSNRKAGGLCVEIRLAEASGSPVKSAPRPGAEVSLRS